MSDVYYDLTAGYIVSCREIAKKHLENFKTEFYLEAVKQYMKPETQHRFLFWTWKSPAITFEAAEILYKEDELQYEINESYLDNRNANLDHLLLHATSLHPNTIIHVPSNMIYFFTK